MARRSQRRRQRRVKRRRGSARADRTSVAVVLICGAALIAGWLASREAARRTPPRAALSRDEARIANAAIPVAPGPVPIAPPFRFHGGPAAREQAIGCLATAALYEAGDDADGQRAVMQVVVNRVRLPGYPKTICGVVYQGATLPTGCQFSFACDGSAVRRPEHEGWRAARSRASRVLAGAVYRPVGNATHYHADYVVPYWLGSLDKTAVVDAHIFYRPRDGASSNPAAAAGARLAGAP